MLIKRLSFRKVVVIAICLAGTMLFSGCDNNEAPNGTEKPAAVTNFTATAGNTQVSLTWDVPSNNGGSEITGYEVTRDNWTNKVTKSANERSHTYTGLTNGTEYTFKVRAVNANGAGVESSAIATPNGTEKPAAVMNFSATAGNGQVSLTWDTPANNGGSEITGYEVTRDNWTNKVTKSANERSHTYTGLTNGTGYTFKVRAVNANGAGVESSATATPIALSGDGWVLINGVKWATHNVDMPGTFVTNPEGYGMFYQWNRKLGWSSSGPITNSNGGTHGDWDNTTPAGTEWETANDPSPAGFRVPTKSDFDKLIDANRVSREWTTINGKKGWRLTDKNNDNSIFFPDAGYCDVPGIINQNEGHGYYWSSTGVPENLNIARALDFSFSYFDILSNARNLGLSVRPVAK